MSLSYNRIVLIGRLTKDPELSYAQTGTAVCKCTIVMDREFSKNNEADFIPLVAFAKTAETMKNFLHKGSLILVEGSLNIDKYDDRDGNKKTFTKVIVNRFNFMEKKNASSGSDVDGHSEKKTEETVFFGSGENESDDIPF
jgi:single-strand DNA-binding protein